MDLDPQFTSDEIALIADEAFFRAKARAMKKVRALLERLYAELKEDLVGTEFLTPPGFDPENVQFVKGEHLEDCPYQYLDFPKHFAGSEKFTFRSLFWWGHHFVFALILEGGRLVQFKQNLMNRYHTVAGRNLSLCLSPSLWEWKYGEGYTLPITHDCKSEVAAVLAGRGSVKIARFVSYADSAVREGTVAAIARDAFRAMRPIITP